MTAVVTKEIRLDVETLTLLVLLRRLGSRALTMQPDHATAATRISYLVAAGFLRYKASPGSPDLSVVVTESGITIADALAASAALPPLVRVREG